MNIYTTTEVAATLGVSNRRVLAIAKNRRVGVQKGKMWLFTESEVNKMRNRKPGRPAKR